MHLASGANCSQTRLLFCGAYHSTRQVCSTWVQYSPSTNTMPAGQDDGSSGAGAATSVGAGAGAGGGSGPVEDTGAVAAGGSGAGGATGSGSGGAAAHARNAEPANVASGTRANSRCMGPALSQLSCFRKEAHG